MPRRGRPIRPRSAWAITVDFRGPSHSDLYHPSSSQVSRSTVILGRKLLSFAPVVAAASVVLSIAWKSRAHAFPLHRFSPSTSRISLRPTPSSHLPTKAPRLTQAQSMATTSSTTGNHDSSSSTTTHVAGLGDAAASDEPGEPPHRGYSHNDQHNQHDPHEVDEKRGRGGHPYEHDGGEHPPIKNKVSRAERGEQGGMEGMSSSVPLAVCSFDRATTHERVRPLPRPSLTRSTTLFIFV